MKRKFLSFLLIVSLMFGIVVLLTACGNKDDENEQIHSVQSQETDNFENEKVLKRSTSSPEEFIEEFASKVNNKDVEGIIEDIDVMGIYAYGIIASENGTFKSDEDMQKAGNITFDEAYEFIEKLKDNPVQKVTEEYEDNIDDYLSNLFGIKGSEENLSLLKDRIDGSIKDNKVGLRRIFKEVVNDVDIKIKNIGKVEKVANSEDLYKVNIKISGNVEIYDKEKSFEDEDDIYIMEKEGKYYVVLTKWLGGGSELSGMIHSHNWQWEFIYYAVNSALNNCSNEYYSNDDYDEYTLAEYVSEADFCKELNKLSRFQRF